MTRRKILFFAEAATLAHVARPVALARALSPDYDVMVARAPRAAAFVDGSEFRQADLLTQSSEVFLQRLQRGHALYDLPTLERYVEADLALIESERPDLIVGDFRLSLSVSARRHQVPYLAISNAYWSPYYGSDTPLPVLPWTRFVPFSVAQTVFNVVAPRVMATHADIVNRLRARHGLPSLGNDLRRVYTDADWLALADAPELFPTPDAPANHRFIGPIAWSPPGAGIPDHWRSSRGARPLAYVSLGSSGVSANGGIVIEGLVRAGFDVWHSAAGNRVDIVKRADGTVFSAPWLPGDHACHAADLVVCNGGSLGAQQALSAGRPVIGVCSNMDQFLNMAPLVRTGAGFVLRADRLSVERVRACADRFGRSPESSEAATRLSALLGRYSATDGFAALVSQIVGFPRRFREPTDAKDPAIPDPRLPDDVRRRREPVLADGATGR